MDTLSLLQQPKKWLLDFSKLVLMIISVNVSNEFVEYFLTLLTHCLPLPFIFIRCLSFRLATSSFNDEFTWKNFQISD